MAREPHCAARNRAFRQASRSLTGSGYCRRMLKEHCGSRSVYETGVCSIQTSSFSGLPDHREGKKGTYRRAWLGFKKEAAVKQHFQPVMLGCWRPVRFLVSGQRGGEGGVILILTFWRFGQRQGVALIETIYRIRCWQGEVLAISVQGSEA
jgi:hypothetical protein